LYFENELNFLWRFLFFPFPVSKEPKEYTAHMKADILSDALSRVARASFAWKQTEAAPGIYNFRRFSQNCEKRLFALSHLSVRLSNRKEQVGSHSTDFNEIRYLTIFRTSVEKIQVSLKSDKNDGYSTWWSVYVFITHRPILLRMRNVSVKSYRGIQRSTFCVQRFVFENHAFCEKMWKNSVESGQATDDEIAHAHTHCMLDN